MENLESIEKTIAETGMFKKGDTVAVACSGGIDSMCLLNYLFTHKNSYNIDIIAVNVDHQIRDNSANDSKFVADFCEKNGIRCLKFKVEALKIASEKKLGIEEAARIARYKIFDAVIEKGLATKIAIAHHVEDQVETILLNIFRGSGLKGASGMDAIQGHFVRPMLNTRKQEIFDYMETNNLQHVEDQTNNDDTYSRNFLRNDILPKIRKHWKTLDNNILNFSKVCKQDDEYIYSQINLDDIVEEKNCVRIPLSHFAYADSVQNRVLRYAFAKLNLTKDIEKRHLEILKSFAKNGQNGTRVSLPNGLKATLEYDYITLIKNISKTEINEKDFKTGKTHFANCDINIKKTTKIDIKMPKKHIIDAKKLPKNVFWRSRKTGDMFAKFGSGEKKLKDYFIDEKIPERLRNEIPLLASGNKIYCVLGYEISDYVKVDNDTKQVFIIDKPNI